ncbi:MAG TPA: sugar transferase [Myxococcota bacterium]|nr:sugar transferase [Myxococcota bacterium]
MKRALDVSLALLGLALASPLLVPVLLAIWAQDGHSPFYVAPRTGRGARPFRMVKLRSMRVGADRSGVDSTAANDSRITRIGAFVRRYKLDELTQLWNVLMGDMSLVGPRPNVERETRLYTSEEARLLSVRPGITDFASIVFSDEGEILEGQRNPDLAYNQLIRPWKSRLGLIYIERSSLALDLALIALTAATIVSRGAALRGVARILRAVGAPESLVAIALRDSPLRPCPPPGASEIVMAR